MPFTFEMTEEEQVTQHHAPVADLYICKAHVVQQFWGMVCWNALQNNHFFMQKLPS